MRSNTCLKAILTCLALAFPLTGICADSLEFALINAVDSIQRVKTGSNLLPWDHAAPGEVIISTSCGFARVGYRKVTTPGVDRLSDEVQTKPWEVLTRIGHYCKLNEFVLVGWHLVAYRTWKGKDYLIDFARIMVGEDQRLYVDDMSFIGATGLETLAIPAPEASDTAECKGSDSNCPELRIYVNTIPMQAGKSLERGR